MKLQNNEESFEIVYDGKDFTVPSGKFEVTNDYLAYFIENTANKWGKDVKIIDDGAVKEIKPEIKPEEEIKAKKTKEAAPVKEASKQARK